MIIAIIGLFLPFVGAITAIILGIAALVQISKSKGRLHGKGLAIGGLVIAVVSMLGWGFAIAQVADGDAGSFFDGLFLSPVSSALDVGDCVDMPTIDTNEFVVSSDQVVPCSQAHDSEYIGSGDLPAARDESYPGDDEVYSAAFDECVLLFGDYVGIDYFDDLQYDVLTVYPPEENWELFGDREYACFVTSIDGDQLTGSAKG